MPAFSTHYIFAKEMMPYIENIADFDLNRGAVLVGTQGPDIFFFHRVLPWMPGISLRKAGSLLHRARPADILEAMRAYCNTTQNPDTAKSYVCGFILHYALDRRCHPYVYALQDRITRKSRFANPHTAHNTVEFSADAFMLNIRLGTEKPYLFDTASAFGADGNIAEETGRLWQYVLPAVTGMKISAAQGKRAVEDTARVQKFLLDRHGIKKAVIRVLETAAAPFSKNFRFTAMFRPKDLEKAKKYVNIENNEWKSLYSGETRTDSFEQLFEQAEDEARVMLANFLSGADCKEITGNLSFLTGVEVE